MRLKRDIFMVCPAFKVVISHFKKQYWHWRSRKSCIELLSFSRSLVRFKFQLSIFVILSPVSRETNVIYLPDLVSTLRTDYTSGLHHSVNSPPVAKMEINIMHSAGTQTHTRVSHRTGNVWFVSSHGALS